MPTKIRPAIFRFDHLPWGWSYLPELAEVLGTTATDVVTRYMGLSKNWPTLCGTTGQDLFDIQTYVYRLGDGIFVPAGWSNLVLEAQRVGAYSVTRISHEHTNDPQIVCPEGTIGECIFDGHFFHAPVGLTMDGIPVWTYAACTHTYGINVARILRRCEEAGCTSRGHNGCGPHLFEVCRRCGVIVREVAVK